ncbi:hypothetical protein [Peptostreptococcus porci]|uniref:hypothetical protein n=2 Tax=Clostridia TaxID=186801 RepID=UPI002A91CBFB|nr:hypothetical protein [Peptostreptococcus porci]
MQMKNRIERMRNIVSEMSQLEVSKQIKELEETLTVENAVIEYSLNNDIELGTYIYKTNALSDIIESFRIAAYEQGKLEDRLYA